MHKSIIMKFNLKIVGQTMYMYKGYLENKFYFSTVQWSGDSKNVFPAAHAAVQLALSIPARLKILQYFACFSVVAILKLYFDKKSCRIKKVCCDKIFM